MRKHSYAQILNTVEVAIRMFDNNGFKPPKAECGYHGEIMREIKAMIERAMERERTNGKA